MTWSVADTPTTPEFLRLSDAERDRAVDDLQREFAEGRLSQETFMMRMQAALGARNSGQLAGLFDDLPHRQDRLSRMRTAARNWGQRVLGTIEDGATVLAEPLRELALRRQQPRAAGDGLAGSPPVPGAPAAPLFFPAGPGSSFTIGRDQECDLQVADMTVSRQHARLARDADGWLLTDLGSTNGTRLNGWRVRSSVPLRPGDHLVFGSAAFVVQAGRPGGSP